MKMHSPNFTDANIEKLAELFPGCVTESKDDKGNLKKSIDFDQLRQELSDSIVDGPQERYQLNWPGKREALLTANTPIAKTLRPCREESVDFDRTKNLFIEGDNLDALKLLQETYLGQVKMIYIDPPYNTGKDFLYSDKFTAEKQEYDLDSGVRDEDGNKLIDEEHWKQNTTANGRFHSDWLSMMYSRLKLARNLLTDNGVIFISIDDGEAASLKKLCDEIFGSENFLSSISWKKRSSPDARATIGSIHDWVLCYLKDSDNPKLAISKMPLSEARKKAFTNPDKDPRGVWASVDMTGMIGRATKDQFFEVTLPSGRTILPPEGRSWGLAEATFKNLLADNRIWFGSSGDNVPRMKRFLQESEGQVVPSYWDMADVGSNDGASKELTELLNIPKIFDTPKPSKMIQRMLQIASKPSDIILDFFSGSSTTAHAVMQLNAEDNGNRTFIMVQLPEVCDEKSEAYKANFKNIAEIGKERIRRAGKKIKKEHPEAAPNLDTGFRVLKVDASNMADVYYSPDALDLDMLPGFTDNIKPNRTTEDLLFQVLLDWGVDLSLPISRKTIVDNEVFFVDDNALAACFEKNGQITEDFCKELAKHEPMRVVFRDAGFKDDSVKINVEQIFKLTSPHTEVKTI